MQNRAANIALGLALLLAPLTGWGQTSEWKWLTGGMLRAVKFINLNEGWVVGHQGLVLHTTDNGRYWDIQERVTTNDLYDVSFTNSRYGWAVGAWKTIIRTSNGGANWELLPTPPGRNGPYYGVCFVDSVHGWITTSMDTILRTTDGGGTWTPARADTAGYFFKGIDFIDLLRGWAVSQGDEVTRTTDGGITWTAKIDNRYPGSVSISQVDSLYGWSGTILGTVLHSEDGWNSWVEQTTGTNAILYGISFVDRGNGWAVGGDNGNTGVILRTTNGGIAWNIRNGLTEDNAFYGVKAQTASDVKIAGTGGAILSTSDGGNNWTILHNSDIGATSFLNAYLRDADRGWAVGTYGVITHTSNGGTVWTRQVSGTPNFIYGVTFPTPQKGWVCSDGAEILITTDSGNNWSPQISNTTMPLFSIDFPDTNNLVGVAVGGYYGPPEPPGPGIRGQGLGVRARGIEQVWISRRNYEIASSCRYNETPRNDAPWEQDTLKPWGTGYDFWKWPWRPEETALTTPYRTITRTTNGGAIWIAQNITGQVPLYGVSFATRAEGWACGDPQGGMGVILHTTDSGATWTGQSSNVTQTLNWIQFKDGQTGWCVGGGGTALWTTDGGTTWNQGNTGITSVLWSCAFYDNLNGFACGNNGLLIKTTDGGRNWTPDTSKVYANFMAINALDSLHAWTVGSYGMVLGWRQAGISGTETPAEVRGQRLEVRIKAQPNPFVSYARVPGREKDKFALYDVTGRRVGTYKGDRIGADATAGIYFLMAEGKEAGPTRIVKIK